MGTTAHCVQRVELISSARGQLLTDEAESQIFADATFCERPKGDTQLGLHVSDIAKGDAHHTKAELEQLVHKHGGQFTQAQLADLSAFVIAGDEKSRSRIKAPANLYRHPRPSSEKEGRLCDQACLDTGIYQARSPTAIDREVSVPRRVGLKPISFFVYASDTDRDGRYYKKTLEQLEDIDYIRDRTGSRFASGAADAADDQEGNDTFGDIESDPEHEKSVTLERSKSGRGMDDRSTEPDAYAGLGARDDENDDVGET